MVKIGERRIGNTGTQRHVRTPGIVMANPRFQDAPEMTFRQGNHPVQTLATNCADNAFAYRIRRHYMKFPRGGRGGIITMDWIIVLKNTQGRIHYPARLPLPNVTLRADEVAN